MIDRSVFLGASATLAALAAAAPGEAAVASTGLVERPGEFDAAAFARMVGRKAEVRQVFDAGKLYPQILGGVKNALNGIQFGFRVPGAAIATAFVTHNESNVLLYGESAWAAFKIGETFGVKDPTGATVTSNIFYPSRSGSSAADPSDPRGFYQDASIATLQKRGVMFMLCNTALVQQAGEIQRSGAAGTRSLADIISALRRSLVPGVTIVPSGVGTITYLQSRYQYAYSTQS